MWHARRHSIRTRPRAAVRGVIYNTIAYAAFKHGVSARG